VGDECNKISDSVGVQTQLNEVKPPADASDFFR
jgi:hypothetical protein